jgi:hypothetical protein
MTQNITQRNGMDFLGQSGITGLVNPSSADPTGAVNVGFLTGFTEGIKDVKDSVTCVSTANVVGTYVSASKTFTATANGILTLDGYSPAVGDRVGLPFQTTASQNGAYVVTNVGSAGTPFILTRAADFNTSALVTSGAYFLVINGTIYSNSEFVLTTPDPIVLDTTALSFTLFSPLNKLTVVAPITKTGNQISLDGPGTKALIGSTSKFSQDIAAATTTININHALNTTDLSAVFIYDKTTKQKVYNVLVTVTDTNNVALDFGFATTNINRVIVTG